MKFNKIVLATLNEGKVREFQDCFADMDISFIPQSLFTEVSVAETGLSFIENAIIKARFAAEQSHLPALADDSGLCVPALAGEPGIYSARYAETSDINLNSSQNNINKLLYKLKDVPDDERQASFHCVLAFVRNAKDPLPLIAQGHWHGRILRKNQGIQGFGYDPVFQPDAYDCSAAELKPSEKNRISHRAQAIKKLLAQLMQL